MKTKRWGSTAWLLCLALAAGCPAPAGEPRYDDKASAEFVAAWQKRQAGDEAGFLAALPELIKKYPGTRVAVRSQALLDRQKGGPSAGAPTAPAPAPTPAPAPAGQ